MGDPTGEVTRLDEIIILQSSYLSIGVWPQGAGVTLHVQQPYWWTLAAGLTHLNVVRIVRTSAAMTMQYLSIVWHQY